MTAPDFLVDSDIVIKLCIYGLQIWSEGGALGNKRLATIAASRFIIPKRINRSRTATSKDRAKAAWTSFEVVTEFLEPDEAEVSVAAELELMAQRQGFAFDTGESLLVAILVARNCKIFMTGDKRAIVALHQLCGAHAGAAGAAHRVACFEQLILHVLEHGGGSFIRNCVCSEPAADKALSICFRCASTPADDSVYEEGLKSYFESVRLNSGETMSKMSDFRAVLKSSSSA